MNSNSAVEKVRGGLLSGEVQSLIAQHQGSGRKELSKIGLGLLCRFQIHNTLGSKVTVEHQLSDYKSRLVMVE